MDSCKSLIKQDILDENKSAVKLMKLDLNGNKCHKKEVKIGIAKSLSMDQLKVSEKRLHLSNGNV